MVCKAAAGVYASAGERLMWWRSLKVCERQRVFASVSVDLTCCTTRGQGTERQWCLSGRVGLAVGVRGLVR